MITYPLAPSVGVFETEGRLRDYAIRDGGLVDALSMARLRRTRTVS